MGTISSREPALIRREKSGGLVTLLEVLKFNAHHFVGIASTFGQLINGIRSGHKLTGSSVSAVVQQCGLLQKYCEDLDLPLTRSHLLRLKEDLASVKDPLWFGQRIEEAQQRWWDELSTRTFLAVDGPDSRFFDDSQFPAVVLERFPEAVFDASEAGKCLALDRPTASAFHLMRVTEYGLQAIAKQLAIKDPRPNWEPVIAKIDSELKTPYERRQFKGLSDFLANVSAHLNAVKVAWRNRVMHVERKHTMEEAREIYQATCGLMRYIAENLPAEKTGIRSAIRGMIGL